MKWTKLGRIYKPRPLHPKLVTHAANPLAVPLEGDSFAVFFSGRDDQNRSSVGRVDIDIAKRQVIAEYDQPVFVHGEPGTFYEAGVSIGSCYAVGDTRYVLFMGWQVPVGQHWRGEIGRLRLADDLTMCLADTTPFLGLTDDDPVSLSYPWVQRGADGFHMWYGSTLSWNAGNDEMIHVIKHAWSADGEVWQRSAGAAVPWHIGEAQAFSRPAVLKLGGSLHMWFSYRSGSGETYRIGHAVSEDGASWRSDPAGDLDVSHTGWDAGMVEYPFVFSHRNQILMLYNGNGYGESGFGLAVLEMP